MASRNLVALLRGLREVDLDHPTTTFADVRAATAQIGKFDKGVVSISRFRGQSPWERHAKGEELFYVLSGHISFTLLSKNGRRIVAVPKGGVFIVPRNVWHRSRSRRGTSVLVVRGSNHGPVTFAEDPRRVPRSRLIG
jgi:mannose-6-phosphate isomerase-like protein (cupin superfamily)